MSELTFRPVVLIILDGWGISPPGPGNAITQAKTPFINHLSKTFPHTQLAASGEGVGLPKGEDGNSETGHQNLGAGRIVYQDLPRISLAIADGSFFQNEAFTGAIRHVLQFNSKLHLMGLVGSGGVHASNEHLYALIHLAKNHNLNQNQLCLHLFTDGRDSPPTSALTFISRIEQQLQSTGIGTVCSISGRYYAMDRDQRWERTEKTYLALTEGAGETASSATEAIRRAYQAGVTDEFIKPTVIVNSNNQALGLIQDNDAAIFFNFRIDRPRQLTKAFVLADFEQQSLQPQFDPYSDRYQETHFPKTALRSKPFQRRVKVNNLFFATMTEYEKGLPAKIAFRPQIISTPLAEVISHHQLKQLHMSESEKERFVTYYFNGLHEDPYPGEDRIIIPSPPVATYDLKPEMSALEITQKLLEQLASIPYDFVVVNFANPDMVGHSGNIPATVKACQTADYCLGTISLNVLGENGAVIITADHGNAEELLNKQTGEVDTEHSTNPVPAIIAANGFQGKPSLNQQGVLADIAPTVLKLLNIPTPPEMTGKSLI
jgi:2,3-bisphosphoglycerate-independent phosphoglycerate mutase